MIALSKHVRLSTAALSCTGDRLLSVRTAHFLKCGGALYIMLSALHLRCTAVLSDRCCLDMFFLASKRRWVRMQVLGLTKPGSDPLVVGLEQASFPSSSIHGEFTVSHEFKDKRLCEACRCAHTM